MHEDDKWIYRLLEKTSGQTVAADYWSGLLQNKNFVSRQK